MPEQQLANNLRTPPEAMNPAVATLLGVEPIVARRRLRYRRRMRYWMVLLSTVLACGDDNGVVPDAQMIDAPRIDGAVGAQTIVASATNISITEGQAAGTVDVS